MYGAVPVARITIRRSHRESGGRPSAGEDRNLFGRGQKWRGLYTAAETCGSRAPESGVTPGGQHILGEFTMAPFAAARAEDYHPCHSASVSSPGLRHR